MRKASELPFPPPPVKLPVILVVDDDRDTRDMYCLYLLQTGYQCLEAQNGTDLIETALAEQPDLILMDVTMPGISGWEAPRRLQNDAATRYIPIVMLTANVYPAASRTFALDPASPPSDPQVAYFPSGEWPTF